MFHVSSQIDQPKKHMNFSTDKASKEYSDANVSLRLKFVVVVCNMKGREKQTSS